MMVWAMVPIGAAGAQTVITIEIAPDSRDNTIRGGAVETIAIYGPAGVTVDPVVEGTLCFGAQDRPRSRNCTAASGFRVRDINGDSALDIEVQFAIATSGIHQGDTVGCLNGKLTSGADFESCAALRTPRRTDRDNPRHPPTRPRRP